MSEFGLLGEHLSHSWSPLIHQTYAGYDYDLFSISPNELEHFLENTNCRGLNVTIPYKKSVIPYCSSLSPVASRLGNVNTMIHLENGWYGDNTDYAALFQIASAFSVSGKHALVLGSGGAGNTAVHVLHDLGAKQIDVVSRSGKINYVNMDRTADLIINATPVGMYPKNGSAPIDLREFSNCSGVIDLIYNPIRTKLILDAQSLQIPCTNGLSMLVAQASAASELFCGHKLDNTQKICSDIQKQMENIILIGMPGCGKTAVGKLLAKKLSRSFYDTDQILTDRFGPIPDILSSHKESGFRALEAEVVQELGKSTGAVIATGGGIVTVPQNYMYLRQNGILVWLQRPLDMLPIEGRPLSQQQSVASLYSQRESLYRSWSELCISNTGSIEDTANTILEAIT